MDKDDETASGREASILAFLVQHPNNSKRDLDKLLGQMKGRALLVARVLTGIDQRPSKRTREIVDGLKAWAKEIRVREQQKWRTQKKQQETKRTDRGSRPNRSNSSKHSLKKKRKS